MSWVVVVEQWDEDPLAVIFDTEDEATVFADTMNSVTQQVSEWEAGYHFYCRSPKEALTPGVAALAMVADMAKVLEGRFE